jgi:hypothetical protein
MSQIGPVNPPNDPPLHDPTTGRPQHEAPIIPPGGEPAGAMETGTTTVPPAQAGAGGLTSDSSTADVARDQATDVKDTTKEAGQQVVEETKQQAANVVAEARDQTGNLLRQGASEISSQAGQQQQRLAESIHSMAQELGSMASASHESGPMQNMVQEASRRGGEMAHWLENHEPSDVLDQLRSFARRRPATFLLGAAAAGVLVGRLSRGLAADAKASNNGAAGTETYDDSVSATYSSTPGPTTPEFPAASATFSSTSPGAPVDDPVPGMMEGQGGLPPAPGQVGPR